jgi:hypothetical protein
MKLDSAMDWIAWAGIVLPLCVLAWTAWRFTADRKHELRHKRFERFFSVTDKIGQEGGSILSKVAALYELRRFPEYSEVIIRMTENPDIRGSGRPKEILEQEFRLINEAMRKSDD